MLAKYQKKLQSNSPLMRLGIFKPFRIAFGYLSPFRQLNVLCVMLQKYFLDQKDFLML